jgi:hypothetical protein
VILDFAPWHQAAALPSFDPVDAADAAFPMTL